MGLSNYIPSSRIAQSGVCTSSTRPASPFEGQMIYETDTNRVLVWDNAAWVMIADTDQPPGLQLVKSQTVGTGVSSVTVTDAFNADYDAYKITVTGGVGTVAGGLNLQLGAKVTGYRSALNYNGWASTPLAIGSTTATSMVYAGSVQTDALYANIEIFNPFLATNTLANGCYNTLTAAGTSIMQTSDTTQYTSFTLFPSSGTITGGTIRVFGYRN